MLDQDTDQDMDIVCEGCGVTFVLTAEQAARRARRGVTEPLTHCSVCRSAQARSARATPQPSYTGDPNEYRSPMACEDPPMQHARRPHSFPRPASGPNTAPHPMGGGAVRAPVNQRRGRTARQMFAAVCSNCGATAHVPFQPSRFQQVLCRSCYHERRGAGNGKAAGSEG